MNNNLHEAIRSAYLKYFRDEITFINLIGEINKLHTENNLHYVFILTPARESQFHSNIIKSLYKYGGTK